MRRHETASPEDETASPKSYGTELWWNTPKLFKLKF